MSEILNSTSINPGCGVEDAIPPTDYIEAIADDPRCPDTDQVRDRVTPTACTASAQLDPILAFPGRPTVAEILAARQNALICAAMVTCAIALTGVTSPPVEQISKTTQTSTDNHHPAIPSLHTANAPVDFFLTQPAHTTAPTEAAPVVPPETAVQDLDPATYELVGADHVQMAFNYLVDVKHMPDDQAAALIANWKEECPGLKPELTEGFGTSRSIPKNGGYGLSQLTLKSRKDAFAEFLRHQPAPHNMPDSFEAQMDFALFELNGTHKPALDAMNNNAVLDKKHPHSRAYDNAVILLTMFEMPYEHEIDGNNARLRGAHADQIMATKHLWVKKYTQPPQQHSVGQMRRPSQAKLW